MGFEQDPPDGFVEVRPADIGVCILDRYEIVKPLGRGAFGTVLACRDRQLGNSMVALKILSKAVSTDPKGRARLACEVRAAYRVVHDHVVRFYDLLQVNDFLAIVMEYVAGPKLRQLIEAEQVLPVPYIVELLRQICEGLKAIHAQGIVHRDLKPDNILISEDSVVKITDFGIASLHHESQPEAARTPAATVSPEKRRHAHVLGTVEYVSPEAVLHRTYDARSDIYALGVIAYELITSRYAFDYKTRRELLQKKTLCDPLPPHHLRRDCPLVLSEFCEKAMRREPEERFPSAEACLSALRDALKSGLLSCGAQGFQLPSAAPLVEDGGSRRRHRRRKGFLFALRSALGRVCGGG